MKNKKHNSFTCTECIGRWFLIDWRFKSYWWGTFKTMGFKALLTLACPLANTILNWKYRDWRLKVDTDSLEEIN